MLDISNLRSDTAIVIYGVWLYGGNSSAAKNSVLDISKASRSTSMKSVARSVLHATPSAIPTKDGTDWNTTGSLLVCSAYSENPFQPLCMV